MSEQNRTLLVDVGNTRIKYLVDSVGGAIRTVESFDSIPMAQVNEIRVATVSRKDEIEQWSASVKLPVRIAKVIRQHRGLTVAYEDEQRLGVDRWLAMLALWEERQSGFCVVDLGTAITVDYVSHEGLHQGGYIIPGFGLMKQALGVSTAQVGFGGNSENTEPGIKTEDCVDHGINRMVLSLLNNIEQELQGEIPLVLTGGDAVRSGRFISGRNMMIDETLVLRGLRYCFE